ncbi:AAA family ATPase [Clostridium cochlearium]|uniref:AAA family ATPase n=1 Tax=Clostridium cochlearium TaxID=1494 RepID=UPI001C0E9E27|nr:AAA family ATPase [Clostridium cochlearium]MBU5269219.1 AAA family ATPase [Clostridium cochlearium]
MIIQKIILNNFRQFKGRQEIEFSTDKIKNVTVVKGENGAGKTTLLEAFTWCFYRQITLPNKDKILNSSIENKMKIGDISEVSVEVKLRHSHGNYIVRRKNIFEKINSNELKRVGNEFEIIKKSKDGTLTKISNKDDINSILPEDLSTYFFFDGERIENLSKLDRKGKKDISKAVRNILGLDVLEKSDLHLGDVIKDLEEAYVENDSSKELNEKNRELNEKKNEENRYKNIIETIEDEIEITKEKLNNVEKLLKENEKSRSKQEKRENYELDIRKLKENIEALEDDIKNNNSDSLAEFIASKLLKITEGKINLKEISNKGIIGIDGAAIDHMINIGKCICGREIQKGTSCYEHLLEQKKYQPPASLGTIMVQYNEKLNDTKNKAEKFLRIFTDKYKQIEINKEKIDGLNVKIDEISNELINTEDIREIEENKNKLTVELNNLYEKLGENKSKLEESKSELKKLSKKLEELALGNGKNKIIVKRKRYCEALRETIDDYYQKKEQSIRKELSKKVSDIFDKLIETDHKIEINEDYTFRVIDVDGNDSTSQGQDILTSFAFIGGLIDLAKSKLKYIDTNEPYPLIMDAPFAKLSNSHRKNVATVLPNISEQFILFTVDSQYEGEIENNLKSKIDKEYELVMHVENIVSAEKENIQKLKL